MRICFTSDLHGNPELYEQLGRLVEKERPDLLILGGDMLSDGELDDPLGTQGAYARDRWLPLLAEWRQRVPGLATACILGNHDWRCTEDVFEAAHERGETALLTADRTWTHRGVQFIGYSKTPPTPYWVKDYERLDQEGDELPETGGAVWDAAARQARPISPHEHFRGNDSIAAELALIEPPAAPWIFVCHGPPYASHLDRLPHIEEPLGSRAIRAFIERSGPLCALHGHFHESPDVTGRFHAQIGGTICVNPGQRRYQLCAVTLNTDDVAASIRHTVFR